MFEWMEGNSIVPPQRRHFCGGDTCQEGCHDGILIGGNNAAQSSVSARNLAYPMYYVDA